MTMANDFPEGIMNDVAHRPWPLPDFPWVMTQSWHNLLFAHWPVDAAVLRSRMPPGLPLDLYDGQAWIGVVPFGCRMWRRASCPLCPEYQNSRNSTCGHT
jgi:uncharacterized protein YqjF (DUF2071 family)